MSNGVNKNKIKTIFIGTPDFGVPAFNALIKDEQFDVVAVITQPDRPVGRQQILTPPPIKKEAEKHGIQIMQPEKLREIIDEIKNLRPDIIVVVAYAKIIPEEILNIPKYGCINIHGSLLPKYRGAAVIQASIMNGDKESGITIIKMDKNLDTGPILSQKAVALDPDETAGTLFQKLSLLGAEILLPTLKGYIDGEIKAQAQDDSNASYVKTLSKEDGKIDWNKSATELERFIRAMSPWPSAWTTWKGKILKITKVEQTPHIIDAYPAGEVFMNFHKMAIQCGIDAIIVERLQLEGKKEISAQDFLRGYPDMISSVLT